MLFGKKKDELFNQSDLPTENDVYIYMYVCMYVGMYYLYFPICHIFVDKKLHFFSYINISFNSNILNIYII